MSHCCPAAVITCIDFRFWQKLTAYFEEQGLGEYDLIAMAGGAKNVLDEDTREIIFNQLDICTCKHEIRKVYLVNHVDCGAYGGSSAFASSEVEEDKLTGDLAQAKKIITKKYPKLEIITLLMKFDKIRTIENKLAESRQQ